MKRDRRVESPQFGELRKYSGNPVLRGGPQPWDSASVRQNGIYKEAGIYNLFYSGLNTAIHDQYWQIGLATSSDMLRWEKYAGNPVLTTGAPGEWDSFFVMYGKVVKKGNTYCMLYMGASDPPPAYNMQIGLATSTDLRRWGKHPGNPVLRKGSPGEWDSRGVWDHSVLFHNGVYILSYGGNDLIDGQGSIGIATSRDLVHWEKHPRNPVIRGRLECTELFEYGDRVHMLYIYWDAPYPKGWQTIGLMSSDDMIHWSEYSRNPLLRATDAWEGFGVDDPDSGVGSPAVILEGNRLRMIYHGGTRKNWNIGYAEAKLYGSSEHSKP